MGMGSIFQPSPVYFVILILMAALCLFVTVLFQGFLSKYQLPFMGFPFLVTIWILLLSAKYLTFLSPAIQAGADFFNGPFFHLQSLLHFICHVLLNYFVVLSELFFFKIIVLQDYWSLPDYFLYSRFFHFTCIIWICTAFYIYHFWGLDLLLPSFLCWTNYILLLFLSADFIVANTWSFIAVILYGTCYLLFALW